MKPPGEQERPADGEPRREAEARPHDLALGALRLVDVLAHLVQLPLEALLKVREDAFREGKPRSLNAGVAVAINSQGIISVRVTGSYLEAPVLATDVVCAGTYDVDYNFLASSCP